MLQFFESEKLFKVCRRIYSNMRKNIIRLLIFFLTLSIGLGVYFVFVSNSVQEISPLANDSSINSASSKTEDKSLTTDFYNIASCTDANSLKKYKYPRTSPTISRGVLNGLVICGTLPEHFPTTKTTISSGVVKVDVLIDEAGEVIKAHATDNNSMLSQQVEKAVYQTRFCPTLLGGENMKVRGILVYQFNSERGFWLPRNFPVSSSNNFKR